MKDRKIYEEKKRKFTINKIKSKKHGDTMPPPYSEQEILDCEQRYDIKIPNNFRKYLLEISRENLFGSYPYTYCLKETPEEMTCKEQRKMTDEDRFCHSHICEKLKNSYFVQYNNKGCNRSDYLCVKGPIYGLFGTYAYSEEQFMMEDEFGYVEEYK